MTTCKHCNESFTNRFKMANHVKYAHSGRRIRSRKMPVKFNSNIVKVRSASGKLYQGKIEAHTKARSGGHILILTDVKPLRPEW